MGIMRSLVLLLVIITAGCATTYRALEEVSDVKDEVIFDRDARRAERADD